MSYFSVLAQNVQVPAALQSTANINAGVTSAIGSSSTLNVAGIQWNLYADQNCLIYIDQSPNNIDWYLTDQFNVYANQGASATVQATASYVRIRIKNIGLAATTTLALQTALCPIVEAVPRALSAEGNLKVGVYEIESAEIGKRALVTPMNALKVVEAVRLVGTALFEPFSPSFWTVTATGSGAAAVTGGQTVLTTGATNGSTVTQRSVRVARYVGGSSNYFRGVVQRPAVVGANVQRWGAYSAASGCFFKVDNVAGFSVVTRKGGIDTEVPTGSFNGVLGVSYVIDTNVHTWEILWTNSTVWFYLDGELLHKVSASAAPWADTMSLPVAFENANGANINDNALNVRAATISRLGHLVTQAQYAHISTLGTTVVKSGAGNLHSITIGTVPTSGDLTVTLYDNTAAAGAIISVLTTRQQVSQRGPVWLDMSDVPFSTGLTVVTAGTAGDVTIVFE